MMVLSKRIGQCFIRPVSLYMLQLMRRNTLVLDQKKE